MEIKLNKSKNYIELSDSIFREYDIRGIFNIDLNELIAEALGRAFVKLCKIRLNKDNLKLSVGSDVRHSSNPLARSLIRGINSMGAIVVDVGSVPTPLLYFSIFNMDLDGGIMITGSHNPPEYNGFKISVGKDTIHGSDIQVLKDLVKSEYANLCKPKEVQTLPKTPMQTCAPKGKVEFKDIKPDYINYMKEQFSFKNNLKVVLDGGNATAGLVAEKLFSELNIDFIPLFMEPDGNFPNHHPDPTVEENLKDLKKAVIDNKADFGIGFDGDSDRIGVVDEKGVVIWGDMLLTILSRDILSEDKYKGAPIVGEVKSSQTMYDEIARLGGKPVMWKTGHSLIKSKMKELNSPLAGEMSGHIFFADKYFGFDDALYAGLRLCEILDKKRVTKENFAFSSLLDNIAKTVTTPEIRVECDDKEKFEIIDKIKNNLNIDTSPIEIREIIDIDGLRIVFNNGWGLMRSSNTQPVIVLRFEAETIDDLENYKDFFKEMLVSIDKKDLTKTF